MPLTVLNSLLRQQYVAPCCELPLTPPLYIRCLAGFYHINLVFYDMPGRMRNLFTFHGCGNMLHWLLPMLRTKSIALAICI